MYSFEGNFRSVPQVSLGGHSAKIRLDKDDLIQKAKMKREKREQQRRELKSSIVIQSVLRSYFARKHAKNFARSQFDELQQSQSQDLKKMSKLLCFFFDISLDNDADKLSYLCRCLMKTNQSSPIALSSFGMSRILVLCSRSLLKQSTVPPTLLRMLETFLIKPDWLNRDNSNEYYLWKKIITEGSFFQSMLHIFESKVPMDIESIANPNPRPHMQLANSLLQIMMQPLLFVSKDNVDQSSTQAILQKFTVDVLGCDMNYQVYNYILPELGKSLNFPLSRLLSFLANKGNLNKFDNIRNASTLSAFIKLTKPKLEQIVNPSIYLSFVRWNLSSISFMRSDIGNHDEGSDEDDDISHYDIMHHEMTSTPYTIPTNEMMSDCVSFFNSKEFVNKFIRSGATNVIALAEISYMFIAKMRMAVHNNRYLYTLAFSKIYLKDLWNSIVSSKVDTKNNMRKLSSIHAFLDGRDINESLVHEITMQLVTFSSLFSYNFMSLHDLDFYQTDPTKKSNMPFNINEIVFMVTTLRDICLCLVKVILPETRARDVDYDVRFVVQQLTSGKLVYSGMDKLYNITSASLLFKTCSRLLNQLHTRHTRQAFTSDDTWLSTSIWIKDESSKYLSNNWRKRQIQNNSLAAYMADPSDEDLPLTIGEARQITILTCLPFVIPFQTRLSIFNTMLSQDRQSRATSRETLMQDAGLEDAPSTLKVKVRRDFLYEDAFNDLSMENAPDLRRVLRVTFVNQGGLDEAGYGGGVTREFIQQLVKTGFQPSMGLFKMAGESGLYPNPYSDGLFENVNKHYFFLGRLLGKVLYESMQVELPFATFFLCKLLQTRNSDVDINHLQSLDPDFYKNLMYLHSYTGDVADLDLNFTVVDDNLGVTKVTELLPGGQEISVTNDNKIQYMHLLSNYKLNVQLRSASNAFRDGLAQVVPLEWLKMFDHRELQTYFSGAEVPIDVGDMRTHAAYSGGYKPDDEIITLFWSVISSFTEEEKRQLLLFVTSCSRPPLLGFEEMYPPFCIHCGGEDDRLPTSSTCLNLLRLPKYKSFNLMKEKLLYCLNSQSGFELS